MSVWHTTDTPDVSVLCRAVALLCVQGYLVVIPDYFKGNPRKQSDSMDTFAEW